jgi:hypothetical protein
VVVGQCDLRLVGAFLLAFPGFLTLALLTGQTLVLVADLLRVGSLAGVLLVFKHAAHAQDGFFLHRVGLFLFALFVIGLATLTHLLVGPVPLVLRVPLHPIVVDCTNIIRTVRLQLVDRGRAKLAQVCRPWSVWAPRFKNLTRIVQILPAVLSRPA